MDDRTRSLAVYYAMLLRARGYSPENAAEAVAKRYPSLRPELERGGLLPTPKSRLERWSNDVLAKLMEET